MPENVWIVVGVTTIAVVVCVALHYEALRMISGLLPPSKERHRRRIVYLILWLLFVHSVEIWVFGASYYGLLLRIGGIGELVGMEPVSIFNCVYYSAVVFSTLGFGDIVPVGAIRSLTGMEAIAGLTFITWSASFTFVEMSKSWDRNHG